MDTEIFPNVQLPDSTEIGAFCVLGYPFRGMDDSNSTTVIGPHSTLRSHTVIYAGNRVGSHFQTGHHAFIRELNSIGNHVSLGTLSVIEHHVTIGNGVRIHTQVFIPEFSILEDGAWIGPNVVMTNASFPGGQRVKERLIGPTIGCNAKIGANATLLPGVKIGRGALVGAGSVVTKDVPEYTIVKGNPARESGSVFDLKYDDGESVYLRQSQK